MSPRLEDDRCGGIVEIIPPARKSCGELFLCDCCRQRKSPDNFDQDAFGICNDCLCSDPISMIADLNGMVRPA